MSDAYYHIALFDEQYDAFYVVGMINERPLPLSLWIYM